MTTKDDENGQNRRGFPRCMARVGTGAVWTMSSGVLKGTPPGQAARGRMSKGAPAFVLHTGDLTHLSRPAEFDTLQQVLSEPSLPVFFVPGEHDVLEDDGKSYLQRFGEGTQGAGWHSFDTGGVHFIGLVNVVNLKAGGLGSLGAEQLEWLETDSNDSRAARPSSSSRTFRSGLCIRNGTGGPTTARRRSPHLPSRRSH